MKASLKFRDEQKPLVRAKIPVSILGLPFLSGISAGETKELRLDLGTAFESGPAFRVSYRPNDSWNPFSLVVKTGIGDFGSPADAPMTMSAEFNLVGRGSPSFSIQFNPRFGDFCVKKATGSVVGSAPPPLVLGRTIVVDHETDGEGSTDGGESPSSGFRPENGVYSGKKANGVATGIPSPADGIRGLFSGAEVTARSVLPLRNRAAVKFRWGVKIPPEFRSVFSDDIGRKDPAAGISLRKLPLLVMSKISIEHVVAVDVKPKEKAADVAEACFSVQRQLAAVQAENGMMRRAVEQLRADLTPVTDGQVTVRRSAPESPYVKGGGKSNSDTRNSARTAAPGKDGNIQRNEAEVSESTGGGGGRVRKEDVNEELKKALMGATGAGN